MENKHTLTPYSINEYDKTQVMAFKMCIANTDTDEYSSLEACEANAEFIVTACNNYQALKEENDDYVQYLKELKYLCSRNGLKTRAAEIEKLLTKHNK
jgi:hypothetical protein